MTTTLPEERRTVTDLKKDARKILAAVQETRRPMVLTANGKPEAVIMNAKCYERHLKASNLARLLRPAEEDAIAGRARPIRTFLKEFKNARKI
ncbi:type II toxin-antitoxin system Phd/YefM family antitoxin [Candidatus Sumerlaeota bacterium]|nr:type II toxin-antitoxin system Phd/YefM family antitoxin [Candidatus Sumerlaeota bacterium]MBI3735531.1 type II toxin-antitoxin system Phd/YefM family antitoxin [Candidatus Sumerlaeota bacterium]